MTAVLKFGGTSVKNVARIHHVCEIIRSNSAEKKIVVVSAMGDTTDQLLTLAGRFSDQPDKRELDQLLATGEQVSISLLAMALRAQGLNARSYTGFQLGVLTDAEHNSARILDINKQALQEALSHSDVLVVAGFQGMTERGEITTLGRGGSDTSAVALAAAVGAPRCDIYTDVDGICTADPNIVKHASVLDKISFADALGLALNGAQVIHPRAVTLAESYNICVRVRNTFKPWHDGTLIKGETAVESVEKVIAVSVDRNYRFIRLERAESDAVLLDELALLIENNEIGADAIEQNADPRSGGRVISLVLRCGDSEQLRNTVQRLQQAWQPISVIGEIDAAKITVLGHGLSRRSGYVSKLLSSLRSAKIEAFRVACSDRLISCLVPQSEAERACRIIHEEFGLGQSAASVVSAIA